MKDKFLTNKFLNFITSIKIYLLVLVLFSVLTFVLTYPLIFSISSSLPGAGDITQMVWYFWITGEMLSKIWAGSGIFHTIYIFYPAGIQMIPFGTAYNQILALIIVPVIGSTATCNILYLSAFIIGGIGAYALSRHITGNDAASVVAGIVYTFAPFHFAHAYAGHLGSVTMQWIPFCALFIMRTFERKDLKDAAIAACFFILVSMSDLQYMVFMGLFVMLYILYGLLTGTIRPEKKTVTLVIVFGVICLIGVLPLTYSMISTTLSNDNYLSPDVGTTKFFSNDLLSFFVPAYFHPVFGQLATTLFYDRSPVGQVTPWEITTYAGICVLILSIYAVFKDRSRGPMFWALGAVFFALMSLGPVLHIAGNSTFFGTDIEIPMPYSLVSLVIPTLSNSRTPGRFDVMVVLSLSVLVAYAIAIINKKLGAIRLGRIGMFHITLAAITLLILFEYLAVPFTMTDTHVPGFYYSLANETGNFGILEIPATQNYTAGVQAEYYQTVHQKYLVGGQVARAPQDARDFETNTPLVNQLTYLTATNDIFRQNVTEIGNYVLNEYDIRYVILHRDFLTGSQLNFTTALLNDTLKSAPIYDSDNIIVYKVDQTQPKLFMIVGSGWYGAETSGNDTWRWMGNSSTIQVYTPEGGDYDMRFNISSFYAPRTLQVWANGEKVQSSTIETEQQQIIMNIHLSAGNNMINLISGEGSVKPSDIPVLDSIDSRSLSFEIRNISIT
jgi:hypothetical protein